MADLLWLWWELFKGLLGLVVILAFYAVPLLAFAGMIYGAFAGAGLLMRYVDRWRAGR